LSRPMNVPLSDHSNDSSVVESSASPWRASHRLHAPTFRRNGGRMVHATALRLAHAAVVAAKAPQRGPLNPGTNDARAHVPHAVPGQHRRPAPSMEVVTAMLHGKSSRAQTVTLLNLPRPAPLDARRALPGRTLRVHDLPAHRSLTAQHPPVGLADRIPVRTAPKAISPARAQAAHRAASARSEAQSPLTQDWEGIGFPPDIEI
jgi:hypothetical protein